MTPMKAARVVPKLVEVGKKVAIDGYAFIIDPDEGISPDLWNTVPDEVFVHALVTLSGEIVGARFIDGHLHHVMIAKDGDIVAALPQNFESL